MTLLLLLNPAPVQSGVLLCPLCPHSVSGDLGQRHSTVPDPTDIKGDPNPRRNTNEH